jgi:hypothetical protein
MAGRPYYDRVMERSTTTGTGTYTLLGAYTGFQTFAAVGNGVECYYCAEEINDDGQLTGPWEVGVGTYASSGTTLARTDVLRSSNSDNAVNWSAGTRRIFLTFPADAARGMVLIAEEAASASATLDFTDFVSNAYDTYVFFLVDVIPATDTADLYFLVGTGGGPSWATSAGSYQWAYSQTSQLPNSTLFGSDVSGDTLIKIAHSLSNDSADGTSGEFFLYSPQSTTHRKKMNVKLSHRDSNDNFINAQCAAEYTGVTAVTGARFLMSSGNITSGTIRCYGVAR